MDVHSPGKEETLKPGTLHQQNRQTLNLNYLSVQLVIMDVTFPALAGLCGGFAGVEQHLCTHLWGESRALLLSARALKKSSPSLLPLPFV